MGRLLESSAAMGSRWHTRSALVLASLVALAGCGRDLLPNNNFGSLGEADEADEGGPGAGADDGVTTVSTTDDDVGEDGPTSSTDEGPSSDTASEGPTSDTADESEDETASATTASTEESTDADDQDDVDESDSFDGVDTWGTPPDVTNEPCAPLAQDCFPTHKCVPYATVEGSPFLDANKCMPILGDKIWGEPCTLSDFNEAQDDCNGEGFCWNLEWVEGELHGTCVPFCVGSPQDLMCPEGWGCLFSGAVALCAKQCHPLAQDCPLDYGCYWAGNGFDCGLVASPGGDLEACDMTNDCVPGLACVDKALVPECSGSDVNCCTPWCDITGPDTCAAPRSCVPFFEPGQAPPGFGDVGVCILG